MSLARLPDTFAGHAIRFRIPYTMPGELIINLHNPEPPFTVQYPEATFLHTVDKPFEIHRVMPRVTGLITQNYPTANDPPQDLVFVPQTTPNGFERVVRLRIDDTSKNERWTKAAQMIENMIWNDSRSWELDDPYTIVRSEGFTVQVDIQRFGPFPFFVQSINCVDGEPIDVCKEITKLKVELTFQGYLIVIAPPSETR